MKKVYLSILILFLLFPFQNIKSQGLLGGEIRWDCIPVGTANGGKFVFFIKVYQACYNDTAANPLLDSVQVLHSNSPAGVRLVQLLPGYPKDISPICNADTSLPKTGCGIADSVSAFNGAHRLYIYADTFALNATPPATGWSFWWNGGARNRSSNLNNSGTNTMRLLSKMFSFANLNTYPCFDNAPGSAEAPVTVTCKGYPFKWYPITSDFELDSLDFSLAPPLDSNGNNHTFVSGKSYLAPLPNTLDDPANIPAVWNPKDGSLQITTHTAGGFFYNHKISAHKCGVLVAEIYRESYFQFYDCDSNVSPQMQAPFQNGTSFIDTVLVCQRANFNLLFTDSQNLANGLPQSVKMMAYSNMFGNYIPGSGSNPPVYDTTNGCISPPCASLKAAPSKLLPISDTTSISTNFTWQTDCGHLATNTGCGNTSNTYHFYFKYWDDNCPVPAYNFGEITLVVSPQAVIPPPVFDSVRIDSGNGNIRLYWQAVQNVQNHFSSYLIFTSNNYNGPYSLLDSTTNINDTTYLHTTTTGLYQKYFYYLSTQLDSKYYAGTSDTLSNYLVDLNITRLDNPFLHNKKVQLMLKNDGGTIADSIVFRFMQPDSTWIIETWKGRLAPEDSMLFVFNTAFQITANPSYNLCVYADVALDMDTSNNHRCIPQLLSNKNLKIIKVLHPLTVTNRKVWVQVCNLGLTLIDTIDYSFIQPDGSLVNEQWTGYIAPGDTTFYKFSQKFLTSQNPTYNLCVKAKVNLDIDTSNNIYCMPIPISITESRQNGFKLVSIAPNPVQDKAMLIIELPKAGMVQLNIYDLSGRIIIRENFLGQAGNNSLQFNVSPLEAGMYFFNLEFEGHKSSGKFVVR